MTATERRQRRQMLEAYSRLAIDNRIKTLIVHRLIDHPSDGADDPHAPQNFGVLRSNRTAKHLYCALARAVEFYQEDLNPTCSGP